MFVYTVFRIEQMFLLGGNKMFKKLSFEEMFFMIGFIGILVFLYFAILSIA